MSDTEESHLQVIFDMVRADKDNIFAEGAPPEAIKELQQEIGITLPESYVDFLKEFDGGEFVFGRIYRITECGSGSFDFIEQLEFAQEIIEPIANQELIPFGDDYHGNYYCFDFRHDEVDCPIVLWEHQSQSGDEAVNIADNFAHFIIKTYQTHDQELDHAAKSEERIDYEEIEKN